MDYYFIAADDAAALTAKDFDAGPAPHSGFISAEAKDIMACPHLEQLVSAFTGTARPSLVAELQNIWPESNVDGDESGLFITRLPDQLRDDLAAVEVTPAIAQAWASELWGFEADDAAMVANDIISVARQGQTSGQSLYWWSSL